MTLAHPCYDRWCVFRAFLEGNERATGIEPAIDLKVPGRQKRG
jgi:hypothetical protein